MAHPNKPSGLTFRLSASLLSCSARSSGRQSPERPPDLITDGNGVVMKVKLTTKQKRDRRWKIKRRKARRLKTGV